MAESHLVDRSHGLPEEPLLKSAVSVIWGRVSGFGCCRWRSMFRVTQDAWLTTEQSQMATGDPDTESAAPGAQPASWLDKATAMPVSPGRETAQLPL